MKLWVTVTFGVTLALLLLVPVSTANAQEFLPVSVTQVHTYQWEWGYVGVQPSFGFWLGDRFEEADLENAGIGGYTNDSFTQEPIVGAKLSVGFGSNVDWVGTEFYLTVFRDGYHGTRAADNRDVTIDQWAAKFGFHIMAELISNEAINDAGEITKDANIGITLFGGFYVEFFPDKTFDLRQGQTGEDITITDDVVWTSLGIAIDIPIGNFLTITGYAQTQILTYYLERLELLKFLVGNEQDRGDWNMEKFAEHVQFHFGGMIVFTPHFNTFDDHHWRFYGGVTFSIVEGQQPEALLFSAGINFGW